MKNLLFIVFILFSCIARSQSQKIFQINGTLKNIPEADRVYLRYHNLGKEITDTAQVNDGSYAFTGMIYEPQAFTIWIKYKESAKHEWKSTDRTDLFLTNDATNLSSENTFSNMEVSGEGGVWNKDYIYFIAQIKRSKDSASYVKGKFEGLAYKLQGYRQKLKSGTGLSSYGPAEYQRDSILLNQLDNEYLMPQKRLHQHVFIPYIKSNPNSPLSFWALRNLSGVADGATIEDYNLMNALFSSLAPSIKKYPSAQSFALLLERSSKTAVGAVAPEITLPDSKGQSFSLSALKGKYTLVHFWASWCGPCRGQNPEIKKIYDHYKTKGFDILAVSLDAKKADWEKALFEDKMPWNQVLDDNGVTARLYQVGPIPRNFLIGPDGKVIAQSLQINELKEKLQTLIGK